MGLEQILMGSLMGTGADQNRTFNDYYLIEQAKRSLSTERLRASLGTSLSRAVISRCRSWPSATLEKTTMTNSVAGVKNSATRTMEAKAGLRGDAMNPERVYQGTVEKVAEVIKVANLKLHLLLEASPEIMAITHYQERALSVLTAVLTARPELLELSPDVRVEKISTIVAYLATTCAGAYWVDMPPYPSKDDLANLYQEVLDITIGPWQMTEATRVGVIEVDQEMALEGYLNELSDDPANGEMNMAIIANLSGQTITFKRSRLNRRNRATFPTTDEVVVVNLSELYRGFSALHITEAKKGGEK